MPPKLNRNNQIRLDTSFVFDKKIWNESTESSSLKGEKELSEEPQTISVQEICLPFKNVLWQTIKVDNENFYLKGVFEKSSLSLLLTNLIHCWICKFDSFQLETLNQQFNPQMEIPTEGLIKLLKQNIENKDLNFSLKKIEKISEWSTVIPFYLSADELFSLKFSTKISNYSFKWKFVLNTLSSVYSTIIIKEEFILPILFLNLELSHQRDELISILTSKQQLLEKMKKNSHLTNKCSLVLQSFDENEFVQQSLIKSFYTKQNLPPFPHNSVCTKILQEYSVASSPKVNNRENILITEDEESQTPPSSLEDLESSIKENQSNLVNSIVFHFEETPSELKKRKEIEQKLEEKKAKKSIENVKSKKKGFV